MKNIITLLLITVALNSYAQSVKTVVLRNDGFITEILTNGDEQHPIITGVTEFYAIDSVSCYRLYFTSDYTYNITFTIVSGVKKVSRIEKLYGLTSLYVWTPYSRASKSIVIK